MWIWRWWRWLCGYVVFRAEGGMCERFLQLLAEGAHPVEVWHVQYAQSSITATCRVADYKWVRPAARRTGTRVRHIRQSGAHRLRRPLAAHAGVVVGAAFGMAVYMLLASSVWVIDVQTEDAALCRRIETQLAASGLVKGANIRAVDTAAVSMEAIAAIDELHQLSLYFDGCIARVEVRLQEEHAPLPDNTPANIVAAADGVVRKAQVTAGQSLVQVGEAVVEGDLLVCGAIETEKGVLLRHARAVILAQTTREFTVTASREEWRAVPAKTVVQPTLQLFDRHLPLYSDTLETADMLHDEGEAWLMLFGTPLPLGVTWTRYEAQRERPVTLSKEAVQTLAQWRMLARARRALGETEVLDVALNGAWDGEVYTLTATFTCLEDIAKTVPLLTDMT